MNINHKINKALKEFSLGNRESAYKKLKKLFSDNEENHLLRFNLAVIEQSLNLNEQAKKNYTFLIKKTSHLKSMVNLYLLYLKEDNFYQALELINKLIKNNFNSKTIMKDKAFVLYKLKNYDESIKICKNYLELDNDLDYFNILGLNYFSKQNFNEAESIFKKGLMLDNNNITLLNSLGRIYHEQRDSKNAEKYLLKAYKIDKNSYEIINNLAGFYREESDYSKSIDLYKQALKINPNNPSIINNLAKVYFDIDNIKLAKKYCKEALNLNKEDGNIQKILSLIYFREQNFQEGWKFFDGRLRLSDFVEKNSSINKIRKKLPLKSKIEVDSKLLVLREQGVGDEILYGTIYPDLLSKFKNVTIECDKRLINLFKNSFPDYKNSFVELGKISEKNNELDNYDYVIYAGSLGNIFRDKVSKFSDGCYMKPNNFLIQEFEKIFQKNKKKYNIGISWKSFKNRYSDEKSLRLEDFINILKNKKCNFINLQYGDVESEIKSFKEEYGIDILTIDNLDLFNDFDKLAAVLKNLDLFISVSNSTAHLSGSLGVKTLLVKPKNHAIFHYWNQPNNKTPWYKSITLLDKSDLNEERNILFDYLNI